MIHRRKLYSTICALVLLFSVVGPMANTYAGTCEEALGDCLGDCELMTIEPISEGACKSGCYIGYMGCDDGDPNPGIPE